MFFSILITFEFTTFLRTCSVSHLSVSSDLRAQDSTEPFLVFCIRVYLVHLMGNIASIFSLGCHDSLSFENVLKSTWLV